MERTLGHPKAFFHSPCLDGGTCISRLTGSFFPSARLADSDTVLEGLGFLGQGKLRRSSAGSILTLSFCLGVTSCPVSRGSRSWPPQAFQLCIPGWFWDKYIPQGVSSWKGGSPLCWLPLCGAEVDFSFLIRHWLIGCI